MRKGSGYLASMYGSGRRKFTARFADYIQTPMYPLDRMGEHMLSMCVQSRACAQDFAQVEARMDFAAAAGATLAAVNADPRNHFGKHALRRFDND